MIFMKVTIRLDFFLREKILTDEGFAPVVDIEDLEEDDGFCYCEKNPIIEVEHIDMTEPIEENVTFKHVALLYDETEGTYIFFLL